MSPDIGSRTSELLLPPKTGRFCIRATFSPNLAAWMAAHVPATPPPAITRSYVPASLGCFGKCNIFRLNNFRASLDAGGWSFFFWVR